MEPGSLCKDFPRRKTAFFALKTGGDERNVWMERKGNMKKKLQVRYVVSLMSVVAALALSQVAVAADQSSSYSSQSGKSMNSDQSSSSSQNSPSNASNQERVTGTIRSIDASAGTVTVKGALLSKTFHADASQLQGLNVGDKVDVTYSKQGDTLTASQISRSSESSRSSSDNWRGSRSQNPASSGSSSPGSSSSSPSSGNPGSSSAQP